MSRTVFSLALASVVGAAPALALTSAEANSLGKQVVAAKVVEVPAVAAKLVTKADKVDRNATAVAVVSAAIKAYPATLGPVITAALRADPQATEDVVNAALDLAPNSSLTIVAAAAEGAPAYAGKAVAVAQRRNPSRASAYEREVAVVRGRTIISANGGALFTDTGVTQVGFSNISSTNPPTQVYGTPVTKVP